MERWGSIKIQRWRRRRREESSSSSSSVALVFLLLHRRRRFPPPISLSSSSIAVVFLLLLHRCRLPPPPLPSSSSSTIVVVVVALLQPRHRPHGCLRAQIHGEIPPRRIPSPFLSAISDTRPTDKIRLRRLLYIVSLSHPPSALLPLLPCRFSAALCRIHDPDSSVRSACIDVVRSLAPLNPHSLSFTLLCLLSDALLHEQDHSAQIASALCLAAAIVVVDPDSDPDLIHNLQKTKSSADEVLIGLSGLIGKGKN